MALLRSRLLYAVLFLVSVAMLGLVMFSLSDIYHRTVAEDLVDYAEARLVAHVEVQKTIVLDIFKREMAAMEIIAEAIEHVPDPQIQLDLLKSYTAKAGYDSMCLADLTGRAISDQDIVFDISHREYFKEILETKQSDISDPVLSILGDTSTKIVMIASPVFSGDEMTAVVAGAYNKRYINAARLVRWKSSRHRGNHR